MGAACSSPKMEDRTVDLIPRCVLDESYAANMEAHTIGSNDEISGNGSTITEIHSRLCFVHACDILVEVDTNSSTNSVIIEDLLNI